MKFQREAGTCGPASIANALRCFGEKISQIRIKALAETDEHGTDEKGMTKAIEALGYTATIYNGDTKTAGLEWLDRTLKIGPVILCTEHGNHWLVVIGKCLDRYIFINSDRSKKNLKENGTHIYTKRETLKQWYNNKEKNLFAIAINKK